jgi:predicted Zn-dependent protease
VNDTPADDLLRALVRRGLAEAEVLIKRGRSRRLEIGLGHEVATFSQERAWAVRASSRRASLFAAGSGDAPGADLARGRRGGRVAARPAGAAPGAPEAPAAGGIAAEWPEASGRPFRLPEPAAAPPWNEPSDLAAPLLGESEGLRLLESLGRELAAELPGARLLHAALEDGSSESELVNSRGLRVRFRRRLATLHLEAAGPGRPGGAASLYLAEREARRFHPAILARRLADRLAVTAAGPPAVRGEAEGVGGTMLLAPAVAAALLAALLPLLVGPEAAARQAPLRDRRGRIGSAHLTIVDNGRLPGGALECPVDGEGVPTAEAVLVEAGIYRQPLLAWWQADGAAAGAATGCSRRPGWRDLPSPGPTHLYLRPEPRVAVAALLAEIRQGHYLLEPTGAARYDAVADRFLLPVCGLAIAGGRATAPVAAACLCGSASALFKGLAGVGRDLSFLPLDGMIGSPSLLVSGLELTAGR